MFKVWWDNEAPQITIERLDKPAHCYDIETEEVTEKPWFHEVKRYFEAQEYPEGARMRVYHGPSPSVHRESRKSTGPAPNGPYNCYPDPLFRLIHF